jgi:spermidine synthase
MKPQVTRAADGGKVLSFAGSKLALSIVGPPDNPIPQPYMRLMLLAVAMHPAPKRILLLGLGGGVQARWLLQHTTADIEAVEMSEGVYELARTEMGLERHGRLAVVIDDALNWLDERPDHNADLVLVDLFDERGMASVVRSMYFWQSLEKHLAPDAIVVANLMGDTHLVTKTMAETLGAPVTNVASPDGNVVAFSGENRADIGAWRERRDEIEARTGLSFAV